NGKRHHAFPLSLLPLGETEIEALAEFFQPALLGGDGLAVDLADRFFLLISAALLQFGVAQSKRLLADSGFQVGGFFLERFDLGQTLLLASAKFDLAPAHGCLRFGLLILP